jgi:hypothetical protein
LIKRAIAEYHMARMTTVSDRLTQDTLSPSTSTTLVVHLTSRAQPLHPPIQTADWPQAIDDTHTMSNVSSSVFQNHHTLSTYS